MNSPVESNLLEQVFNEFNFLGSFPDYSEFRINNREHRKEIDSLVEKKHLRKAKLKSGEVLQITLDGLLALQTQESKNTTKDLDNLIPILRELYILSKGKTEISVDQIAEKSKKTIHEISFELYFLTEIDFYQSMNFYEDGTPASFMPKEEILDISSIQAEQKKKAHTVTSHSKTQRTENRQLKTAFATYVINEDIGHGGNGKVVRAVDDSGEQVAIKILNIRHSSKEKTKRFKNEYLFCSKNSHENIIRALDQGVTSDDAPFFVMPLYKSSLRPIIQKKVKPEQAYKLFCKILDGIDAAHKQNVTHRDLKPENILVSEDLAKLVITDFGIAEFGTEELYTLVETKQDTKLANFQYAAPEQRTRGQLVDKRADIYALGLILHELFTQEIPHGRSPRTIASAAGEYAYLDGMVDKMLQQNPSSRYESIETIKSDLIARGDEQIRLFKLNELKNTVVPTTELSDKILNDPIHIIDVDWNNSVLTIILNQEPNDLWIWSLQNMGGHTSVWGKGPEQFRFHQNKAIISAQEHEAQKIIDYFKQWLLTTATVYENKLKRDLQEADARKRNQLAAEIKKIEERERVKKNLRF